MVKAHSETKTASADHGLESLESIIGTYRVEPLRDDETTVARFAEETGRSPDNAAKVLVQLVKAGKMERRIIIIDGSRMYAYRPKGARNV